MTEPEEDRIMRGIADAYGRPAPIDPAARDRLDRAIERERAPRRRAAWSWTGSWRLHPALAAATLLATLAGGIVIGRFAMAPAPPATGPPAPPAAGPPVSGTTTRVIEFVLVAPHASSVVVVGDFNDWDAKATPMRRAPDGESWTVTLPVPEGLHAYAFVVDGTRWVADPVAPLAPGDGFGFRNSILVVGGRG